MISSMPALGQKHYRQSPKNYPEIKKRRHIVDIEKIEYDHIIKIDGAAARDLPQASAARYDGQPSPVPVLILFEFVRQTRARTDQAHLAPQNVKQLGQLVKAGFSQDAAYACDAGVVHDLTHMIAALITGLNKLIYKISVSGVVSPRLHRAKLVELKWFAVFSDTGVFVKNTASGCYLY